METSIRKRTFDALNFPKGSKERENLNCNKFTSEYMTSYKFVVVIDYPETDKNFAYQHFIDCRTLTEAKIKEQEVINRNN